MEKAIVVGATGGTGAAITEELVKRGIRTVAFGRSLQKLERLRDGLGNPENLTLAAGDAFRPHDIVRAAEGADVLFHCANVPYHEMESKLIPLGESVMEAAGQLSLKVVAIDGIYPYGRRQMERVTEDHPKQPHTRKGKTRLAYEQMLFDSRWKRARVMIVRLPDYYGPTANEASYLGSTLEAIAAGRMAFFIGNMRVPREYVYLPDAAFMIAELAAKEEAYGENWNIPGAGLISGKEIVRIARQASGSSKPVIPLGRGGLALLGMFVPVMKEVIEMLYLTEEPLVLSGEKYESLIGPIRATAFEEGIGRTVRLLQGRNGSLQ
ncbi:NAD-dependent epimerase/dehydratase family protein [Brevibacillus borstelensis]|uniref:NAD-dependent epimerase/dehydratase family protein n=1 Tax=Brevibacillus borstelensis TaxID=45462 RepID=UPI001D0AAC22|nr:NAD-dependent epimerase/dehydratase family protein [Brevibacillus borstelensis]MCC0563311.1 NAD-dependent epimerase/dehydratase family protein [Brevibacillus borstelensis]MCM3558583.1 NAD-dependent epimerase/dehydratase family protein [Brevibacillus borstelensis]MCM3589603.1 NAD-dependent epimerase/dehydratase family protein [Brevibacillus borstelensis]MED1854427.1 NAD-dependent epimerase/dehydratase family protein [Brevibacillus borstelensis]